MEEITGDFDKETGEWIAAPGSPFRSLTVEEIQDLRRMAESTIPRFTGHPHPELGHILDAEADAPWEAHHPLAREIWTARGLAPK